MGAKDKAGSRGRGGPCSGCCRGTPKPLPPRERTVTLNDRSGANKAFPLNKVSNTKYTLWTFVPKNLYEQFSAPMNLYFLLIALLQLWRTITPVNPITTWAPLLFVCFISAGKEAVDDLRRASADKQANSRQYQRYSLQAAGGTVLELPSGQGSAAAAGSALVASESIQVGDVLCIQQGEEVPCDMLLLSTGAKNRGTAFIETANLDGETDLKTRTAVPFTQQLTVDTMLRLQGRLRCPLPNPKVHDFTASLTLQMGRAEAERQVRTGAGTQSVLSAEGGESGSNLLSGDASSGTGLLADAAGLPDSSGRVVSMRRSASTGGGDRGAASAQPLSLPPSAGAVATPATPATSDLVEVTFPLDSGNLIQHGTVLRRTEYIIGLAVYTGADTKMNQNKGQPPSKTAHVDTMINAFTVGIFAFQLLLVLAFGLMGHVWSSEGDSRVWYLGWQSGVSKVDNSFFAAYDVDDPELYSNSPALRNGTLPAAAAALQLTGEQGSGGLAGAAGAAAAAAASVLTGRAGAGGNGYARRLTELLMQGASHLNRLARGSVTLVAGAALDMATSSSSSSSSSAFLQSSSQSLRSGGAAHWDPRFASLVSSGMTGQSFTQAEQAQQGASFPWYTPLVLPLRFLLLSSMMVPISLKVSMDLVKFFHARMIANDQEMRDEATDTAASATSTVVAEDLGRVQYCLTDKTGTLTDNVMTLAALSIGRSEYYNGPLDSENHTESYQEHQQHEKERRQKERGQRLLEAGAGKGSGTEYSEDSSSEEDAEARGSSSLSGSGRGAAGPEGELSHSRYSEICGAGSAFACFTENHDWVQAPSRQHLEDERKRQQRMAGGSAGLQAPMLLMKLQGSNYRGSRPASAALPPAAAVARSSNFAAGPVAVGPADSPAAPASLPDSELAVSHERTLHLDFLRALALCNGSDPNHLTTHKAPVGEVYPQMPDQQGNMGPAYSPPWTRAVESDGSTGAAAGDALSADPQPWVRLVQYSSLSPDDEALAYGAAQLGVALAWREKAEGRHVATLVYAPQLLLPSSSSAAASAAAVGKVAAAGAGAARAREGLAASESLPSSSSSFSALQEGASASTPSPSSSPSSSPSPYEPGLSKSIWLHDGDAGDSYEVLQTLEFSSERKMMSVLLRKVGSCESLRGNSRRQETPSAFPAASPASRAYTGLNSGDLILISKGADEVMYPRLCSSLYAAASSIPPPPSAVGGGGAARASSADVSGEGGVLAHTKDVVERFAEKGLRTLIVAGRTVSQQEYERWLPGWKKACASTGDRAGLMRAQAAELEKELVLLGATAIEDRLQVGVARTIADLRKAGIRFWMVTGDKYKTALQIARAAKLTSYTAASSASAGGVGVGAAANGSGSEAAAAAEVSIQHSSGSIFGAADTALPSSPLSNPVTALAEAVARSGRTAQLISITGSSEKEVLGKLTEAYGTLAAAGLVPRRPAFELQQQFPGLVRAVELGIRKRRQRQQAKREQLQASVLHISSSSSATGAASASATATAAALSGSAAGAAAAAAGPIAVSTASPSAAEGSTDLGAADAEGESWGRVSTATARNRSGNGAASSTDGGAGSASGSGSGSAPGSSAGEEAHYSADSEGSDADDSRSLAGSGSDSEEEEEEPVKSGWGGEPVPSSSSASSSSPSMGAGATAGAASFSPLGRKHHTRSSGSSSSSSSSRRDCCACITSSRVRRSYSRSCKQGCAASLSSCWSCSRYHLSSVWAVVGAVLWYILTCGTVRKTDGRPAYSSSSKQQGRRKAGRQDSHGRSSAGSPSPDSEYNASADSEAEADDMGAGEGEAEEFTLILEGSALQALQSPSARGQAAALKLFSTVATACDTVICCRSEPRQKAELVRLVKETGAVTLAIGDGGNDVMMIQEAHIGVGLSGREGKQAARAADYSFAQFRFLLPLLLVHGRYSHYRTSLVAQYTFYKSMIVCGLQMLYNGACAYSGCSLLDTFSLTTYNLFYTFLPGLLLALDMDRPRADLLQKPELYRESSSSQWLTPGSFLLWVLRAAFQAGALYYLNLAGLSGGSLTGGASIDQATFSYTIYTAAVTVQMITLASIMWRPTVVNHLVNAACFAVYFALFAVRSYTPYDSSGLGVAEAMADSPAVWFSVALSTAASVVPFLAGGMWQKLQARGPWADLALGSSSSGVGAGSSSSLQRETAYASGKRS